MALAPTLPAILSAEPDPAPRRDARLEAYQRERTALAGTLAGLRSDGELDATGAAICHALVNLGGIGGAALFAFEADGIVSPLAAIVREGGGVALPGSVPAARSAELRGRAAQGPWVERWDPDSTHPYRRLARTHAVTCVAYAAVRSADDVVGLLAIAGGDAGEGALLERIPALAECAAFTGALLGPRLQSLTARSLSRDRIGRIITDRSFSPVFQPIIELASNITVGYEALTRFVDGRRPDLVFAEASACGLGLDLEVATLNVVVDAATVLPAETWLNLNVSADLVLDAETLRPALERTERPVVLELTEHVEITDYAAVRDAVDHLGPHARLAVDDAGAGFASLRHILELRPDYIKLDRAIVHHVHRDAARQALVAGLVHFAAQTGSTLIAEGVESGAEARKLQALGVPLAQGHWLGRPANVARIVNPIVSAPSRRSVSPSPRRPRPMTPPADDIDRAVNIGPALGAALREVGVSTIAELRSQGAMTVWERIWRARPSVATGAALLHLEGAARGVRISQISPTDRARLRLHVRTVRTAA